MQRARERAGVCVAGLALAALAGCAGPGAYDTHGSGGVSAVTPTSSLLAWRGSRDGVSPQERFEWDRRDALLNPKEARPLRATEQWPAPPVPAERRIDFRDWDQR